MAQHLGTGHRDQEGAGFAGSGQYITEGTGSPCPSWVSQHQRGEKQSPGSEAKSSPSSLCAGAEPRCDPGASHFLSLSL